MKLLRRKVKERRKTPVSLILHSNPTSLITEQYKQLRTNIEFSAVDKQIKSIMVTSPEPGDGKSTTAANLAIVLAQQGKQVVLVDADLRKPSVHHTFQLDNLNGLTSVITKQTALENAICQTYVLNLNILTSGPIPPNPSELLNSRNMESVIEEINRKYDYIIFDTPPALAVTDAKILSNKCDGIVMVIASEKTNKQEAKKAKKMLQNSKAPLLGVVYNKENIKPDNYNYF
ncbi:CpsD/CapB family tyrosine-protein kinase [Priestia aryabhattai]|uniref:CpsD/CapB family tyrosine-protein kinase n=1 Tax=Priestia aryabhattai TaxID=412384 RepID=UPI0027E20E02|nr:CpsD/CapB family tyrosine-protein kinase [Priestia aryabhattai]